MKNLWSKTVMAAVAAAGMFGIANTSSAALVIDIRAESVSGGAVLENSHNVTVTGPSATVTFGVYAVVTGGDAESTNDGFQAIRGYITAPVGDGPKGHLVSSALVAPFNGSGSTVGQANADINGDAWNDLGTTTSSTTTSIAPRSSAMTNGSGGTSTFKFFSFQLNISQLGQGLSSTVDWTRVGVNTTVAWQQDGGATLNAGTGTIGQSIGVTLNNVPEPASLGVVALGGLALLARRRK